MSVAAIDHSVPALELARRRSLPNVRGVAADATALPLADRTFDAALVLDGRSWPSARTRRCGVDAGSAHSRAGQMATVRARRGSMGKSGLQAMFSKLSGDVRERHWATGKELYVMFSQIVVPLDGNALSYAALPATRAFARATGAAVTLVRVSAEAESRADVMAHLKRVADELAGAELNVQAVVPEGDPAEQIVDVIRARGADLVIMRTHGRSGPGDAVLGSVVDGVMQASIVPMVLLRPGGRRLTQLRKLIVPIDGSPGGAVALGTAIGLSKSTGAALHLVQIVVPIPTYLYASFPIGRPSGIDPVWDTEAQAAAQTYSDSLATRLRGSGVQVTGEVVVASSVAEQIVQIADQRTADLIVMSSQALTGAARALLGSVSDAVVRLAHCPVLVIHRPPTSPAVSPSVDSPAHPVALPS
jgi:nucleotide-binding universal stress UspA family protein